ncbi:MAG: hypothetical protein ACMUIP_02500 [bacterium]
MGCNNLKRVLFRADANPKIGIGDLMSLIHLSYYFKTDGWETFFMIRSYTAGLRLAEQYGIVNCEIIDNNITIPEEVCAINKFVHEKNISLIFFEVTENRVSDYVGISSDVYKACVSFDGFILPDMDVVVDWDVEATRFFQPEKYSKTKFLLGPEYVILPFNFDFDRIKKRKYTNTPERLLICMGGADEFNLTCRVVNVLKKQKIKLQTTIVIGAGYAFRNELEDSLKNAAFPCEIKENISDMFEEYMKCDIAIGTGGLTSSELVATRTPALLIAAYEHQVARCKYFHKKGWVYYLGYRGFKSNEMSDNLIMVSMSNCDQFFDTYAILKACNEFVT